MEVEEFGFSRYIKAPSSQPSTYLQSVVRQLSELQHLVILPIDPTILDLTPGIELVAVSCGSGSIPLLAHASCS
jgi:hypothetical protein